MEDERRAAEAKLIAVLEYLAVDGHGAYPGGVLALLVVNANLVAPTFHMTVMSGDGRIAELDVATAGPTDARHPLREGKAPEDALFGRLDQDKVGIIYDSSHAPGIPAEASLYG